VTVGVRGLQRDLGPHGPGSDYRDSGDFSHPQSSAVGESVDRIEDTGRATVAGGHVQPYLEDSQSGELAPAKERCERCA